MRKDNFFTFDSMLEREREREGGYFKCDSISKQFLGFVFTTTNLKNPGSRKYKSMKIIKKTLKILFEILRSMDWYFMQNSSHKFY